MGLLIDLLSLGLILIEAILVRAWSVLLCLFRGLDPVSQGPRRCRFSLRLPDTMATL